MERSDDWPRKHEGVLTWQKDHGETPTWKKDERYGKPYSKHWRSTLMFKQKEEEEEESLC